MSQNHLPRQITVAEMAPHIHNFAPGENKVDKISKWLINWIETALQTRKINPSDMLPSKGDLAFHIGVSKGTIQNVFRYVEDYGLLQSKQKIGTFVVKQQQISKLTSKREFAAEMIKKYLYENSYKKGDRLISIRKLSLLTGISTATIRIAIGSLISKDILKKENNIFIINKVDFKLADIQPQTLVTKIAEQIEQHIIQRNYHAGEKFPSNQELANKYNVSIKTIHDAIKLLSKSGILYTRRGQYGTVVTNMFSKTMQYSYERIEVKLRNYIMANGKIGSRLPSIAEFAEQYHVSAKTVKHALDNLAEEGYITFIRGRYGGTFITDIPQGNDSYKWLAISPDFVPNSEIIQDT